MNTDLPEIRVGKDWSIYGNNDFTYYLYLDAYAGGDAEKILIGNQWTFLNCGKVFSSKGNTQNSINPAGDKASAPPEGFPEGLLAGWFSWEGRLRLSSSSSSWIEGRALLCKCSEGRALSLTIRRSRKNGSLNAWTPTDNPQCDGAKFSTACKWSSPKVDPGKLLGGGFLVSTRALIETIIDVAVPHDPTGRLKGLIVVSGSTGSAKSTIARGVMSNLLSNRINSKERRSHVVTLEDPIEVGIVDEGERVEELLNIDYTARQLGRQKSEKNNDGRVSQTGIDCPSLAEGLTDALRMTPAAFYIGEVRAPDDWKDVLKFAGSGHFVTTTTHAGSLVETFKNIVESVDAGNPSQRGSIAEKLLAVIHLKKLTISLPGEISSFSGVRERVDVLLPQLWVGSHGSIAGFTADGFSSVRPVRGDLRGRETRDRSSCWARVSFVEKLISESLTPAPEWLTDDFFTQIIGRVTQDVLLDDLTAS